MARNAQDNGAATLEVLQRLEARLGRIEEELREVKAKLEGKEAEEVPWWKKTMGMFKDTPNWDEFVRECEKIREADRKAARAEWREEQKKEKRRKAKKATDGKR
jgi:hypothetical protein